METRLLAYEHAGSVEEIAAWGNGLVGKEVPGDPEHSVVSVMRFQMMSGLSGYDAMFLVEVRQRDLEEAQTQVALKEADIEVIEELTASIDEPI